MAAPCELHGCPLLWHPVKWLSIRPELAALISPTSFVFPVHLTSVGFGVSRRAGFPFDTNGFGNGPDHSGNAEADGATAALSASAAITSRIPAFRRRIADPFFTRPSRPRRGANSITVRVS